MPELKEIAHWKENDIQELPRGEFDWLDYKSSPWFSLDDNCLNELSKYASAFGNYDGGYLVIGVRDPDPKLPLSIDGGVSLSLKRDLKSWLEDKVPTLTDPPLNRLSVALIGPEAEGSRIKASHAVIVIHFYPSQNAPHQARDKKCYTRLGSKLGVLGMRPILDISQRVRYPKFKVDTTLRVRPNLIGPSKLFWRVHNDSDVMARHIGVIVQTPIRMYGKGITFEGGIIRQTEKGEQYWSLPMNNNGGAPLFPRATIEKTFDAQFHDLDRSLGGDTIDSVNLRVYADSMPYYQVEFDPQKMVKTIQ